MAEKLKIPYPIIVEGKYDKIKLDSIVDGEIFITSGFGIFKNEELSSVFRRMSERSKVIILTDSDGGGTQIRKRISALIPKERRIDLYIPSIPGKEKRKDKPSKAGTLGVEGIDADVLRELLTPFADGKAPPRGDITKTMLFELGLTGCDGSAGLRAKFAKHLGLPADISSNAFLAAVNILYAKDDFCKEFELFQTKY